MADNNLHLCDTLEFDSRELARLTRGEIVSVQMDEVEDAFSEWDENAPIAQLARGSQSNARPATSRTITQSAPLTTRRLAQGSQRLAVVRPIGVPETLEEALLALMDELSETDRSDR